MKAIKNYLVDLLILLSIRVHYGFTDFAKTITCKNIKELEKEIADLEAKRDINYSLINLEI